MRAVCVHVVDVFESGVYHMLRRVSVPEQLWMKESGSGGEHQLESDPGAARLFRTVTPEPFLPDQIGAGLICRIQESFWMLV